MYIQIIWLNLQTTEELENFAELDDVEIFLIPEKEFFKMFTVEDVKFLHYKSSGHNIEHLSWLLDNTWYVHKLHDCKFECNCSVITKIIICGAII